MPVYYVISRDLLWLGVLALMAAALLMWGAGKEHDWFLTAHGAALCVIGLLALLASPKRLSN